MEVAEYKQLTTYAHGRHSAALIMRGRCQATQRRIVEQAAAKELALRHVALPVPVFQRLSEKSVRRFLGLMKDKTALPIYLHCLTGVDRASVFVAVYRMSDKGWSADKAYEEMKANGFNVLLFNLADYIYEYETRCGGSLGAQKADTTPACTNSPRMEARGSQIDKGL
ncbi:MAG: hypothetical protein GXP25_02800 [Planctomycetes bacterium]|nr:hypothetical protein [Planctomycetota bacterium]